MKILVLLLFCLSLAFTSMAQLETANWYFGNKAGIRFLDDTVIALTNGQLESREGCATISDRQGQLLFYSNGEQVWGRNHQVLPNGSALLGHSSSTQSSLFVPHPGDKNLYYLFTTGAVEQDDEAVLAYSIIDLRLNNGIGDVTVKNQILMQTTTEKLCGVRHANGKDVWVVGHQMNTNAFYSYLVSSNGLMSTPVISHIGSIYSKATTSTYPNISAQGALKSAPNGKVLAVGIQNPKLLEIFNFDYNSGLLSNYLPINIQSLGGCYSLEFSPDSYLLYINVTNINPSSSLIYQFNISNYNKEAIESTIKRIGNGNGSLSDGTIQLGIDKKIYVSKRESGYLSSILDPDEKDSVAEYKEYNINLNTRKSQLGLPNFINQYPPIFPSSTICINKPANFTLPVDEIADSVKWLISNSSNTLLETTELVLTYTFNTPGNYKVKLLTYLNGQSDTLTRNIEVHPAPIFNIGSDTLLYEGENIQLKVFNPYSTYLWQDGSSQGSYTVTQPGEYHVQLTDQYGCTTSDTITISYTQISIPNVFTPNGDGINDLFVVEGIEPHTWQMSIYNRLGKQVFNTDRYANNWAGKDSDAGIYYYSLTNPRLRKHFKGWVVVIR